MSYFEDGDIERFLADYREEDERLAVKQAGWEQDDAQLHAELIEAMATQGIVATLKDPLVDNSHIDEVFPVRIVATPDGPNEVSEAADHAWSFFAEALTFAKAFIKYGYGDDVKEEEIDDDEVLNAAIDALSTILRAEDISPADKQAAIRTAEVYLGATVVAQPLTRLGFDTSQEPVADPLFDTKASLLRMASNNKFDQQQHNREIKRGLRPQVQAMLSTIIPAEHDDFESILLDVEVAIMVQFEDGFSQHVEESGGVIEAVKNCIKMFRHNEIDRLNLDPYELAQIAIDMAPAYRELGYHSVEDFTA